MKPEQLYEELKTLAEKLDITVSEQSLKTSAGIKVQSGYCSVKGNKMFIMNRNHHINKKIKLLGQCLADIPHEHLFVVPAVREFLEKLKN